MSDETIVQEPTVSAGDLPAAPPEPPKEFTYSYQPKDENGRPWGAPQVIKYDGTPEDLGNKLAEQNSALVHLNRKLKLDLRLGNVIKDEIPANAPRFDESKFQLVPEPLTAEERIQLAQDINDPEKLPAVSKRFVRAELGDPEALRTRLARLEQKAAKSDALEEAEAFRRSCPEYYVHPDNFVRLANWMVKNDLEPVQENFQLAYDNLKEYMIQKPQPVAPAPAPVQKTDEPKPVAQTPARPVSSGLTRSNASDNGPAPKTGYSQAEIDKMSGDEYKRLVLDPEFRAKRQAGRA